MIGRRMPYYVKRGIGGIDANTLLMLHAEDFTDSSLNPKAITNNGATIGSSGKFNKCFLTGGSKTKTVEGPSIVLGTGNFTIDFWIYCTSYSTAWQGVLGHRGAKSSDYGWALQNNTSKYMLFEWSTNGSDKTRGFCTSSVLSQNNIWEHWAIVKNGATVVMYRNGTSVGSSAISGSIYQSTQGLSIGYVRDSASAGNAITASMDEIRISNIARWTANFTPPTEPYSK